MELEKRATSYREVAPAFGFLCRLTTPSNDEELKSKADELVKRFCRDLQPVLKSEDKLINIFKGIKLEGKRLSGAMFYDVTLQINYDQEIGVRIPGWVSPVRDWKIMSVGLRGGGSTLTTNKVCVLGNYDGDDVGKPSPNPSYPYNHLFPSRDPATTKDMQGDDFSDGNAPENTTCTITIYTNEKTRVIGFISESDRDLKALGGVGGVGGGGEREALWVVSGASNKKLFWKWVKRTKKGVQGNTYGIQNELSEMIWDEVSTRERWREYFEQLYSYNVEKAAENRKHVMMSERFNNAEVLSAMKVLKNGKAADVDGITKNQEKLYLYLTVSVSGGLLLFLGLVIGRLLVQRHRARDEAKFHATTAPERALPNGFADDISEIDADIDLTTPVPVIAVHSPPASVSEVVRFGPGASGTLRRGQSESDAGVPRSLNRSGNSQYYYGPLPLHHNNPWSSPPLLPPLTPGVAAFVQALEPTASSSAKYSPTSHLTHPCEVRVDTLIRDTWTVTGTHVCPHAGKTRGCRVEVRGGGGAPLPVILIKREVRPEVVGCSGDTVVVMLLGLLLLLLLEVGHVGEGKLVGVGLVARVYPVTSLHVFVVVGPVGEVMLTLETAVGTLPRVLSAVGLEPNSYQPHHRPFPACGRLSLPPLWFFTNGVATRNTWILPSGCLSYSILISPPCGVPRDLSNLVEVGLSPSGNQVRCRGETGSGLLAGSERGPSLPELPATHVTLMWFGARVHSLVFTQLQGRLESRAEEVSIQVPLLDEGLAALVARVVPYPCVDPLVGHQVGLRREPTGGTSSRISPLPRKHSLLVALVARVLVLDLVGLMRAVVNVQRALLPEGFAALTADVWPSV
uniref:Uncharacterized protein n=1 Tax=Timema tahoe TaxID=61484 RepID=A0A7R9NXF2_9NEOP|nr:unnamed protein product [Timema tahoe]